MLQLMRSPSWYCWSAALLELLSKYLTVIVKSKKPPGPSLGFYRSDIVVLACLLAVATWKNYMQLTIHLETNGSSTFATQDRRAMATASILW